MFNKSIIKSLKVFPYLLLLAVFTSANANTITQSSPAPSPLPWDREALVNSLQKGGHILLIRHERTEVPSRDDDYTQANNDCRAQRNLSVAGSAGAMETRVIFQALNIKFGRVITSPMCRSAETARYMFGVNYEIDTRLMHENPKGKRTVDVAAKELRSLLSEISPGLADSNIALVSHGGVIIEATGLGLSEGEIGVLKLGKNGEISILGQFLGSDLSHIARKAMK